MWILWDNSYSVGVSSFQDKVRPFLKDLIASPQLNVGPDGTHIGIITFSTQAQTRVLLEMGEKLTQQELQDYLDSLTYSQISGDGTRTGMALRMADEVRGFTYSNLFRIQSNKVTFNSTLLILKCQFNTKKWC